MAISFISVAQINRNKSEISEQIITANVTFVYINMWGICQDCFYHLDILY